MKTLTKEEVGKLTPEQQEALGSMEVQHIRSRQQLLARARRGMNVAIGLFTGLASGLAILGVAFPRVLPFAIIALVCLVTVHATRLNQRLDALLELFDEDIKRVTERQSNEDHG